MSFLKTIGQTLIGSGIDKPTYTVVRSAEGYEERRYSATNWASTKVMSMELKNATSTGFWRLFKYIGGENEKGTKIEMTAPVATKIVPGEGPNCESTFNVSFYIPPIHQEQPIPPTNPDVFIEEFPERTVFVSGFGGFASDEKYINEARKLSELIKDEKFNPDFYYTAGYDSPFKLFNRLNEVWFVKNE